MKSTRHPHPHIDPRQPRSNSEPGTNPPVFVWKPGEDDKTFRLIVGRDPDLKDICIDISELTEPAYLPEKAFTPGTYYWTWAGETQQEKPEVFSFEISEDATVLEVPFVEAWFKRFPNEHPRIYIRPEDVEQIRESRNSERADLWKALQETADKILTEKHEIEEPPFLPDWNVDYKKTFDLWRNILQESRKFVHDAEMLGLAYLASGDKKYARAACQRLASISEWDPEGSSHIPHNDEAHMSVVWHGPQACDWVWDEFTDKERELVIKQFKQRGEITYDFMHSKGSYGVTRFLLQGGRLPFGKNRLGRVLNKERECSLSENNYS